MNQTDQFNVKCGDLTPDFDQDMIPKNHILRLINKLGLPSEFSEAFQKER